MVGLPFNPLRTELYSAWELLEGFDPSDPGSFARCPDSQVLSYFVSHGKNPATDSATGVLEALHDDAIGFATRGVLKDRKIVAIMGGHKMRRGTEAYRDVARLARALTAEQIVVVTGGGPGGMEAAHAGALLGNYPEDVLDAALASLGDSGLPPEAKDLVNEQGEIEPAIAARLHAWFVPAFRLALKYRHDPRAGMSVGIPTWLYGFEPTSPLAKHIAKYFQNSIREDGLVTIGVQGIVYAQGEAGTVQEIFQDAAQNYYNPVFSPMVFLSSGDNEYWTSHLPVQPLIDKLLRDKPAYAHRVLFTNDWRAAVTFLLNQQPTTAFAPDADRQIRHRKGR